MGIEEYSRKRDFVRTPEPRPGGEEGDGNTFVVHRHEARRLHYDLRIRAGGVLASWAVPKGFSYDPKDKRLAVRTEDHPLEYESFQGVIPRGQYGAGTMQIWDGGSYAVMKGKGMSAGLEKGELKLELHGRRLRGEWHMVRTKGGKGNEWLLFKARDRYAGSGSDLFGGSDLRRARRRPAPRRLPLMEPTPGHRPFSAPGWLFEPFLEGTRVLAAVHGAEVSLRAGDRDLAPALPGIVRDLGSLRAATAVLDGVVVALNASGRPSEKALRAELAAGEDAAVLYLFDLPYAEEWDLRAVPLRERRAALRALVPELPRVHLVESVPERGEVFCEAASRTGLREVVAKRADGPYRPGSSDDWRLIRVRPSRAAPGEHAAGASARRRAAAEVPITHPRKVYWPEQGYTKEDLVSYYERAADWLLPYLRDRPLHLYRWPDGIRGKSFYQKQLPEGLPDWIETTNVSRPGEEPAFYAVCNSRRALLTFINLGSIDLHPWLSRRDSLESPDWAVLDLDPKDAPFSHVVTVARETGKLLRGLGLEPYLKTSGSSGLHVCIPLAAGHSYEQSRMFCEAVARMIVRDHPDIATVERVVGRRGGRVYVDYLQNRREQTVVPPYVVRPVEAASVSMPLAWDELEAELHISDFTLATAPERVERTGDLFRTALASPQRLSTAIRALEKFL